MAVSNENVAGACKSPNGGCGDRSCEIMGYCVKDGFGLTVAALEREISDLRLRLSEAQAAVERAHAWQRCSTHGAISPRAWGCPECVVELRKRVAELEAKHGV